MEPLRPSVSRETPAESGVHDMARAFGWLGGVMLLVSSVLAFVTPGSLATYLGIGVGLLFLAIAQIVSRTKMSPRAASWLWAVCVSVLAVATTVGTPESDLGRFGYVLVLTVASGAVTLTWPSFLLAAFFLVASFVRLGLGLPNTLDPAWVGPEVAALIAGALLLVIRRRSLHILEEVDRLQNQLGSTDVLTGVLTRQGLITLGPTIGRAAQRTREPVFAMIVDVDDLRSANRDYGTGYGDELLRSVAVAIRSASRDADLLGRWSGDEFALFGMGAERSIDALTDRVRRIVAASPVTLGRPPLSVSIGTAVGSPFEAIEAIVARALGDLERPVVSEAPAKTKSGGISAA